MEKFDFEKINHVISTLIKSNPKNLHTSVTVNSSGKTDSIIEFEFATLRNNEINDIVAKILESDKDTWNGQIYLGSERIKLNYVTSNILQFKVDCNTFVELLKNNNISDSIDDEKRNKYIEKLPSISKSMTGKYNNTPINSDSNEVSYSINIYRYNGSSIYDNAKNELIGTYSGKASDPVTDSGFKEVIYGAGYTGSTDIIYYTRGAKGECVYRESWNFGPKVQVQADAALILPTIYTFADLFRDWEIDGTKVDVFFMGSRVN